MLKHRLSAVMQPDSNSGGLYTVNNLYLDDRYDTSYNDKIFNSYSRDKYRIRYYNDDLSFIRLENKHKDGEMTYKNSMIISKEDYHKIASGNMDFFLGIENFSEKDNIISTTQTAESTKITQTTESRLKQKLASLHRLRQLRPVTSFSYTREAYVYRPGNVRVTFDSNIRSGTMIPQPYSGSPPGSGGMLEVKFDHFLPAVIKEMLDGVPLVHTAMSKYNYSRERGMFH